MARKYSLDEMLGEEVLSTIGDWFIDEEAKTIYIDMPKCRVVSWPIYPNRLENGAIWYWNGDHDKPTLTPSLNVVGIWHGWLKDGILSEA